MGRPARDLRQAKAGLGDAGPRHGVARVLSKAGVCSRTEAARWVQAGRVSVDGRKVLDPEFPVRSGHSKVRVDGQLLGQREHLYLMLNKPRGLVTTTADERGRDTVYRCFEAAQLPWLAPVGRLDKASEGLLLFSSDPEWAALITSHVGGIRKTYHVQVDAVLSDDQVAAIAAGAEYEGAVVVSTFGAPAAPGPAHQLAGSGAGGGAQPAYPASDAGTWVGSTAPAAHGHWRGIPG